MDVMSGGVGGYNNEQISGNDNVQHRNKIRRGVTTGTYISSTAESRKREKRGRSLSKEEDLPNGSKEQLIWKEY